VNSFYSLDALPKVRRKGKKQKGYWKDIENRRKLFLEIAKEQGFDPSVAENWKNVTHAQIYAKKVLRIISPYCPFLTNFSPSVFRGHQWLHNLNLGQGPFKQPFPKCNLKVAYYP